ncbi:MAG: CRISPR-associated endonuclease Cas2 [Candidatus Ryanbacteria bacterium RIFCSPLOWO2_02_FULL_45_11c]|uniref:CRISPR-associated endonuclease Cas2 n=1 Tax=Candidatus Ryanbacteria bacterium RIFCSPLOWO2_02_FULL_45_11c TaxID=1802128 RepID=A0A1G2H2Q9_9BACT|nr:MAG: CRISPR-associated endonuclease Cas2 [Candidatus Ryanbacteria bacterium RIFCSPLOWO2_02_FULL_45_11c]
MAISRNTYTVSRAILATLGVVGFISVAVLAPNALQMFKNFDIAGKKKKYKNNAIRLTYDIDSTISRLRKEKCITLEEQEDGTYVCLTQKGKERLLQYETGTFSKNEQGWDGKWRIVVFDVAEEKRKIRDKFRRSLISYGFKRMQNSVWIYPYDCEDFLSTVKTDRKLWGDVLYMAADYVEGVERYKKFFKLDNSR